MCRNISELTRREREKVKRHNDILIAAEKRFFTKSYDEVSMDDIAGDVELAKATIYLYFKNKQSLYFAIVIQGMIILRDVMKKAIDNEKTGLKKILASAQAISNYLVDYSNYYRLNLLVRGPRFSQMLFNGEIEDSEVYIELAKELLNLLLSSVTIGIKDGSLRSDLDPLPTTVFLSAAIETSIQIAPEFQMLLQQYQLTKEEYFKHSVNVLLHGISGEKAEF